MSHYAHNHLQDDWQADEDRDVAERRERAEHEAQRWFQRATARQHADYHAAMAAVFLLPEHEQNAYRDRVNAAWRIQTREAHDLYNVSVEEIMADGETSAATDDAWDRLCDLRCAPIVEAA